MDAELTWGTRNPEDSMSLTTVVNELAASSLDSSSLKNNKSSKREHDLMVTTYTDEDTEMEEMDNRFILKLRRAAYRRSKSRWQASALSALKRQPRIGDQVTVRLTVRWDGKEWVEVDG